MFSDTIDKKNTTRTPEEQQREYQELTRLFDLAEELVSTIDSQFVSTPADQLKIVEPLIEQLGDSADILTEEYIAMQEKRSTSDSRPRIEGALRRVFMAIDDYRKRVEAKGKKAYGKLFNVADLVVNRIQEQMERVVVIFLRLLGFSLERVMLKTQVEELKRRQQAMFTLHRLGS